MKNIMTVSELFRSGYKDLCLEYLQRDENEMQDHELEAISLMVESLHTEVKATAYSGWHVGYLIKRIGKEFDLLKVSHNRIINIELKIQAIDANRVIAQLLKNKYYLESLGMEMFLFTFLADQNKFVKLSEDEKLEDASISEVAEVLNQYEHNEKYKLDEKFKAVNFLVSPFNNSDKFLNDAYFLTQHQQQIKDIIINGLENNSFIIEGSAGTGKTLLTYDIAKELYSKSKDVCIVHVGMLNSGHDVLKEKGFNIVQIKQLDVAVKHKIVIIDEAQRLRKNQLNFLLNDVYDETTLIFSIDQKQCLSQQEIDTNAISELKNKVNRDNHFKLTDKIRTNDNLSSMVERMFNRNITKKNKCVDYEDIQIEYFENHEYLEEMIHLLSKQGWEYVNFTTSMYRPELLDSYNFDYISQNSHTVIGQEFNDLVVVVDENFVYNRSGKLSYNRKLQASYYNPLKMLYQNISRVRERLIIFVYKNTDVYRTLLEIKNDF